MTRLLSILLLCAVTAGAQIVPTEIKSVAFDATETMSIRLDWNNPPDPDYPDSTLVKCGEREFVMPLTNSCIISNLDVSRVSVLPITVLNFVAEQYPVSTNLFGVTNYNFYGVPSQPWMLLVGWGSAGSNTMVYASSDLSTWQNVYSVIGANEPWLFTEPTQPQRFYKILIN